MSELKDAIKATVDRHIAHQGELRSVRADLLTALDQVNGALGVTPDGATVSGLKRLVQKYGPVAFKAVKAGGLVGSGGALAFAPQIFNAIKGVFAG
jgi:hypothetical protein|tara:strand:- start:137 stop:424 length:288 start_codon:yes stop_codon:yes gene_type:complete